MFPPKFLSSLVNPLCLAVCLVAGISVAAPAQTAEEAAVRGVVSRFFEAYQHRDLKGAMSLWSEKSPERARAQQSLRESFERSPKLEVKSVKFGAAVSQADQVKISAVVEVTNLVAPTEQPVEGVARMNQSFWLVKEGLDWKIWKYASTETELAEALVAAGSSEARAAVLSQKPELVDQDLVVALTRLARKSQNEGQYERALATFGLALDVAKQIKDMPAYATTLYLRGVTHSDRGEYQEALNSFRESMQVSEQASYKMGFSDAVAAMGVVYSLQGNQIRALEYYQKGLLLCEEQGDKLSASVVLNNIGAIYQKQGDDAQALEHFERSLKIKEEAGDTSGIATTLNNIAGVYLSRGDYVRALEYLNKSLELRKEIGKKEAIAEALHNIAEVYLEQGNYRQCLDYDQKALDLADEVESHYLRSYILTVMGGSYMKLGEYASALKCADRSAAQASQAGIDEGYWRARTVAGSAHTALHQLDLAEQAFEDAISTIEKLRGLVAGGEQQQTGFFAERLAPYHELVALSIARNELPRALTFAERAKGRMLLDVLGSGRVNVTKAMTQAEIERDRALVAEMVLLNSRISDLKREQQPDKARIAEVEARLTRSRLEYESFQTSLYAAHPELRARRGQSPPLTLQDAAELLTDQHKALLEYIVAEDQVYLLVITGAGSGTTSQPVLKAYSLNINGKDLAKKSEAFRLSVADRALTIKEAGQSLYNLLLKPAEKQLRGVTKLCIVPDGPLWNLPFQALYDQGKGFLLEQSAIYYAPSLSVLREMTKRGDRVRNLEQQAGTRSRRSSSQGKLASRSAPPTLLAVGNPTLGAPTISKIKSARRDEALGPLPDTEREVKTLGRLYAGGEHKILVGKQATEAAVKADAGKFQILHLATHAVLDDASPMYSRIMLSSSAEDAQQDGMLEAWELAKLDLEAEMVVLSACETARGHLSDGEGVIGMSWALFIAGCPSVVVSQWKVDSARTADLMVEFHRNLLSQRNAGIKRPSKSEALRQAALKLIRGPFNHPVYWASFVLIGDD
jgi:CHAT domain-containing protein/Tfp pilus assembly protein PilF